MCLPLRSAILIQVEGLHRCGTPGERLAAVRWRDTRWQHRAAAGRSEPQPCAGAPPAGRARLSPLQAPGLANPALPLLSSSPCDPAAPKPRPRTLYFRAQRTRQKDTLSMENLPVIFFFFSLRPKSHPAPDLRGRCLMGVSEVLVTPLPRPRAEAVSLLCS